MSSQCIRGSLQIDCVPQHDSRHHQGGVVGPVSLLLETAVANFPQPVEEHSAGQRVAGFAFVQHRYGVLCDLNSQTTPESGVDSQDRLFFSVRLSASSFAELRMDAVQTDIGDDWLRPGQSIESRKISVFSQASALPPTQKSK